MLPVSEHFYSSHGICLFFKLLCLRSSYLGEAGHLNVFSDDIILSNYCFMVVFNDLYKDLCPEILKFLDHLERDHQGKGNVTSYDIP